MCTRSPLIGSWFGFSAAVVLAAGVFSAGGADPGAGGQGEPGIQSRADGHAVVNFLDLSKQERSPKASAPLVAHKHPVVRRSSLPAFSSSSFVMSAPVSSPPPTDPSPPPGTNFLALPDSLNIIPPDTIGAVGPNHVMTTLNGGVRIQDKGGTVISTVSLDTFWGPVGGSPQTFDPKCRYDPYMNRWIFSSAANAMSTSSEVLIGVSQTSDPTGNWNLYSVMADNTGVNWADFPCLGFTKDWIVVSVNMFPSFTSGYAGVNIYVFNKTNLYANGPGLYTLLQDTSGQGFTMTPAVTYSTSLATEYLMEDWSPSSGSLRISTITGPVGSESLTLGTAFPSASTWNQGGNGDFLPQLGSSELIDGGDSRLPGVVYRNGSLWTAQTAFLPASSPVRTAAQWWQVSTNGTVQQFGRVDDPNAIYFYAYPSIAVNSVNGMLLGYSRFSTNQYASGNYSFRYASDPAGTMRSDTVLKAGEGVYVKRFGGPDNRWGDYSGTVVDPANDVSMWTIQEYAAAPVGDPNVDESASRWSTWWGRVDSAGSVVLVGTALVAEGCPPGNGVIDPNETVTVNFTLQNAGQVSTLNLMATLLATNGVVGPSGAQSYGAIAPGGTATRSFSFTASGSCGGSITAVLQLQDGLIPLGTVSVQFPLGVATVPLVQNFDSITPPTLPAGWTTTNAIPGAPAWTTTTAQSASPPNSAFAPDPGQLSDIQLVSPLFPVTTASATLTFVHRYNTEYEASDPTLGYDGCVLEIAIAGGAFTDILAAGGSFASGGYNRVISTGFSNPLGGRQAWSGDSGGFITTVVNLPATAAGKSVQLRWRSGSDNAVGVDGWYLDTISVLDGYVCCGGLVAPLIVNTKQAGTNFVFSFQSVSGQTYALESRPSLNLSNWQSSLSITGDSTLKTVTNTMSGQSRVYRLRSP